MSEQKIFNRNIAVKMVQNRCKSAKTSTKYCSVTMKLGQNITCHILNLIAFYQSTSYFHKFRSPIQNQFLLSFHCSILYVYYTSA